MKYLKVWTSFNEILRNLQDDEIGRLFMMMLRYTETGEEPTDFVGNERFIWPVAKRDIDLAEKKNETNRKNGSKGGRPRSDENQDEATESDEEPEETEEEPNKTENNPTEPTNNPKVKESKEKESKEKEHKRIFTPPTLEEVAAYCKERGNGIDPQYFMDYQMARDWVLSNGKKMQDWRATIRTWEKNGYNRASPGKVVAAQQYGQRDYAGEQEDAMRRMIGQKKVLPAQQFSQRDYSNEDADAINRMLAMDDETRTG